MGLFRKKKSEEEEARLLAEEIGWRITEEEVRLRKEIAARLKGRFEKFWESDGQALLARYAGERLPPELLDPGSEVAEGPDGEEARQAAIRELLAEVWQRDGGRCQRCQRDRGLGFRHAPAPHEEEHAVAGPSTDSGEVAAPPDGDPDKRAPTKPDVKAVAAAKKKRKERARERSRRMARARLMGGFELLCGSCMRLRGG